MSLCVWERVWVIVTIQLISLKFLISDSLKWQVLLYGITSEVRAGVCRIVAEVTVTRAQSKLNWCRLRRWSGAFRVCGRPSHEIAQSEKSRIRCALSDEGSLYYDVVTCKCHTGGRQVCSTTIFRGLKTRECCVRSKIQGSCCTLTCRTRVMSDNNFPYTLYTGACGRSDVSAYL